MEITKYPQLPVTFNFSIEFILKTDSDVKLTITDIQGFVIYNTVNSMNLGINHYDVDMKNFIPGSYIYRISAGLSFYSGVFVKM